jgi:hypothetical protein
MIQAEYKLYNKIWIWLDVDNSYSLGYHTNYIDNGYSDL